MHIAQVGHLHSVHHEVTCRAATPQGRYVGVHTNQLKHAGVVGAKNECHASIPAAVAMQLSNAHPPPKKNISLSRYERADTVCSVANCLLAPHKAVPASRTWPSYKVGVDGCHQPQGGALRQPHIHSL